MQEIRSHDVKTLDRGISWGAVIAALFRNLDWTGTFLLCPFSLHMHVQFKENSIT